MVGKKRWVVLTKDGKISKNEIERTALMNARVRAFVIPGGTMSGNDMAALVSVNLAGMKALLAKEAGPFIATLHRSGQPAILFQKPDG